MKIVIGFFLAITLLCIVGGYQALDRRPMYISKGSQAVHELLDRAIVYLEKQYQMSAIGTMISMPEGPVRELGLSFNLQGPLTKEEIRKLLVTTAQDFLSFINEDKVLQPHLKHYPFNIKDIEITLFIKDRQGNSLADPNIGIASIIEGSLVYRNKIYTYDEELKCEIPSTKNRTSETYEEALATLHKENIATDRES